MTWLRNAWATLWTAFVLLFVFGMLEGMKSHDSRIILAAIGFTYSALMANNFNLFAFMAPVVGEVGNSIRKEKGLPPSFEGSMLEGAGKTTFGDIVFLIKIGGISLICFFEAVFGGSSRW